MLVSSFASANPVLLGVAGASVAYALYTAEARRACVVQAGKGALVSGSVIAATSIVEGPLWWGCLVGVGTAVLVGRMLDDPAKTYARMQKLMKPAQPSSARRIRRCDWRSDMCTDDAESSVTGLVEFKNVFAKLRRADAATARQIETAVRAAMQGLTLVESKTRPGSCQRIVAIKEAQLRMLQLRYHYAAISAQMAEQKSYFYRSAIEAEQVFLTAVYNGLEQYFCSVCDAVEEELRKDSSWMTGLLDTWHKTGGRAINWVAGTTQRLLIMATGKQSVKGFERFIKAIGNARGEKMASAGKALKSMHEWLQQHNAQKVVEERSVLERSLENVCSKSEIEKHVAGIFAAAGQRYQRVWQQRVKSYHAQLTTMDDAAKLAVGELHAQPVFTLGHAEQALAAGMSATIFGTAALAAGWHTLAYAMVNVFWPMAVFIAMLTAGVAWFTKDRAREERISEARRILDAYHAQLVMYIDIHKLEEYGHKSIRELVREHGLELAQHMDDSWRQARFGKLSEEHYHEMMEACERQAERLGELVGRLMQVC